MKPPPGKLLPNLAHKVTIEIFLGRACWEEILVNPLNMTWREKTSKKLTNYLQFFSGNLTDETTDFPRIKTRSIEGTWKI